MSSPAPGAIVALVTHARHVPAVERARFAARLRDEQAARVLIVETCHRVEGYLTCGDDAKRADLALAVPPGGRALVGEAAVHHAVAVAVGRDSVIVGEDQVLHQLRQSVGTARGAGALDPAIERLFALALRAGRRARSWRRGPQRSLADVALRAIEGQCGPLRGREILVVGAGRMGSLAARAAVGAGASVSIANRTADTARTLATTTGARIEAIDPGQRIGAFAGVVVALGGLWPIGAGSIDALKAGTTVVVDLSAPAAVPAVAAQALGSRLVTADDLALADTEPGALDGGSLARYERLIETTTAEFLDWLKSHDGRAAAEALIELADREREAELAALWRRLPDLGAESRAVIDAMTKHLAARLLREPLERLGRDTDGRDEQAVRDIFAL